MFWIVNVKKRAQILKTDQLTKKTFPTQKLHTYLVDLSLPKIFH